MVEGEKREKLYGKRVNSKSKKGKYVKSKIGSNSNDIAIDATIRAAALRGNSKDLAIKKEDLAIKNKDLKSNSKDLINKKEDLKNNSKDLAIKKEGLKSNSKNISIKKEDLREKIRKHGARLSIALVIDMSGSMVSEEKLSRIKSILHKIIANVHINKDKLAVVGFKGKDSELIIPNTKKPNLFLDKLQNITIGGTTPMAAGLEKGFESLKKDLKKEEYIPMLMILSDGVTNVSLDKSNSSNISLNKGNSELNMCNNVDQSKHCNHKMLVNNPIIDVLKVGEEIAKHDIHTVIVNFERESNKGRSVNRELAFITDGNFYDLEQLGDILAKDIFEDEEIDEDSFIFSSFHSDLADMAVNKILDYERDNV